MRIQQLHYIIKIVETGSMNEAANQLFITQPSLSNAVRDLENEMGIEIFIRNPKGITLTRDGMEFLSYARQVVDNLPSPSFTKEELVFLHITFLE